MKETITRTAIGVTVAPIPFWVLGEGYLFAATVFSLYGIAMAMLLKRRNIIPLFRIYVATLIGFTTATLVPFDPARRTYEPIILGALGATAGLVFGGIWAATYYRSQAIGEEISERQETSQIPATAATTGWITNLFYAWLAVLLLFLLFMPSIGYT